MLGFPTVMSQPMFVDFPINSARRRSQKFTDNLSGIRVNLVLLVDIHKIIFSYIFILNTILLKTLIKSIYKRCLTVYNVNFTYFRRSRFGRQQHQSRLLGSRLERIRSPMKWHQQLGCCIWLGHQSHLGMRLYRHHEHQRRTYPSK